MASTDLHDFGQGASQLSNAVDECAPAKALIAEPLSQSRGERLDTAAVAFQRINEPCHPILMPILQKLADEVILAREMTIKGDLGNT